MKPKLNRARAVEDVLAERERQKSVEGWTELHDDEHDAGQLVDAAATYILVDDDGDIRLGQRTGIYDMCHPIRFWPWELTWFKPTDYRRNLVKAAALLLAEIERIDRASARPPQEAVRG